MADCFRKTMAREGVKGLYAGAAAPLWGAMAHNAGVFFSYGMAKKASRSCIFVFDHPLFLRLFSR